MPMPSPKRARACRLLLMHSLVKNNGLRCDFDLDKRLLLKSAERTEDWKKMKLSCAWSAKETVVAVAAAVC